MAKLRNLKIENEALAGVNADDAEISIVITSTEPDSENKSTLTAAVTAEGSKSFSYAWFGNETSIGGDTQSIEVTVGDDEVSYKCTVTATYDDNATKSQDSNIIKLKKSTSTPDPVDPNPDPTPSDPTEPMIGGRKLSEHLRMRLLGYI